MKITTPALSIYLMAGDDTAELAEAAVRGGATAIEIGVPFSDPLADGPVIHDAGTRHVTQQLHHGDPHGLRRAPHPLVRRRQHSARELATHNSHAGI